MSNSTLLPQWPAGRKTISIKEAAKRIEPFLPTAPLAQENDSDSQTPSSGKQINEVGCIDDTYENHVQRRHEWYANLEKKNQREVRAEVIRSFRQIVDLPEHLLYLAQSLRVPLLHPTLGIETLIAPDVEHHITERGFRKLAITLLNAKIAASEDRPLPEVLDKWMLENIAHYVKREQTISACRVKTGARVRDAAAAFDRLPANRKLARGKKPPRPS